MARSGSPKPCHIQLAAIFNLRYPMENSNSGQFCAVSRETAIVQTFRCCHPTVSSRIRIDTQRCELLGDQNLPVMPMPVLLVSLHTCCRSKSSIQPLTVIFAVAVEFPPSTRPAIANVCHFDNPTVAFRTMSRAVDRGLSVEEVVVEWPVSWHAGGQNTNSKLDGRQLGRVDIVPWVWRASEMMYTQRVE